MNIRLGGGGIQKGTKLSEETRKKMSQPRTESHKQHISESCKGKVGIYIKTSEHKQKLADANTGKIQTEATKEKRAETLRKTYSEKGGHSDESKIKMSINRKGKGIGNSGPKGIKHSDEVRKKNSESHIGKKWSDEAKAKLSTTIKGRKFSEETKRRMAENRAKKKQS